jgi:hypothetical protein
LRLSTAALTYNYLKYKELLKPIILCLQIIFSLVYGIQIYSEWGSDYGVYFVGAHSITFDYGLYSDFFDHKGPGYYAFIKILSIFLPFGMESAAIVLSLTCLVWFMSVRITNKILNTNQDVKNISNLSAIVVLIQQGSNSSIAIFIASSIIISISASIKFYQNKQLKWMYLSVLSLGFACFTRIDSLFFLPLIIVILTASMDKDKFIKSSVHYAIIIFLLSLTLFTFSFFLGFEIKEYWNQAILFNLTTYREIYGATNIFSSIISLRALHLFLSISGFAAIILLIFVYRLKHILNHRYLLLILIYFFLVYTVIGSSKNYHVLIVAPAVLIFIMQGLNNNLSLKLTIYSYVILFINALICISLFTVSNSAYCVLPSKKICVNPYSELISYSKKLDSGSEFLMNDGWPYLLMGEKPTGPFTFLYTMVPTLGDNKNEESVKFVQNSEKKYFWFNIDDLEFAKSQSGNYVNNVLSGLVKTDKQIDKHVLYKKVD